MHSQPGGLLPSDQTPANSEVFAWNWRQRQQVGMNQMAPPCNQRISIGMSIRGCSAPVCCLQRPQNDCAFVYPKHLPSAASCASQCTNRAVQLQIMGAYCGGFCPLVLDPCAPSLPAFLAPVAEGYLPGCWCVPGTLGCCGELLCLNSLKIKQDDKRVSRVRSNEQTGQVTIFQ